MLCSLKSMNRRWTSFKLSNLTQGIVSSRLQGTSLQSASSCQARAVSIPGPFVSITTKSWTLFKTNWQVSVLVNTELFIWNIHRRTAKFVLPRKPFLSQRWVPYNFFLLSCNNSLSYLGFRFTPLFNDIRKRTRALAYIENLIDSHCEIGFE